MEELFQVRARAVQALNELKAKQRPISAFTDLDAPLIRWLEETIAELDAAISEIQTAPSP